MSTPKSLFLPLLAVVLVSGCDPETSDDGSMSGEETADGGHDGGQDGGNTEEPSAGSFFLPTDEPTNTAAPRVLVDEAGAVHAVYPAYAGGDAFYAYCGAGCEGSEDVQVVRLPTEGTTTNAMLALDAQGRPRVLLSSFAHVYYASCDDDCGSPGGWTVTDIIDHGGEREITGEAFALDPQGRPRFVMHTYVALLGIGQGAPMTELVRCDDDCHDPAKWSSIVLAEQIWRSSQLRYDAAGHPRLAMAALVEATETSPTQNIAAYAECNDGCDDPERWTAVGLDFAFTSLYDAVTIDPAVSMALTREGHPRLAMLGHSASGARNLTYYACDEDCTTDGWAGVILAEDDNLGAGIDLVLDGQDHPRFVHTWSYNIGIAHCDEDRCETAEAPWTIGPVELGSDIPTDQIFLWPNCTVGAWFLHSPSIDLDAQGQPRIGFQARDISGGWSNPDPVNTPDCVAGTDMSLTRLVVQ